MRRSPRRGSLTVGEPLLIMAVIGGVALASAWEHLGGAWRVVGVAGTLLVGGLGLLLAMRPSGLAGRMPPDPPGPPSETTGETTRHHAPDRRDGDR